MRLHRTIRGFSIAIILLLGLQNALAQDAMVRGFVYEASTGEPVIFSNVYLANSTYGNSTDINGYFSITRIPPGQYTLLVTYLGFDTLRIELDLKPNDVLNKRLYLKESAVSLQTVNVTAERMEATTETRTSVVNLTPRTISRLPSVGGQADLAQYLQVLPGVVFTGDQGGQLYIRGGAPIQNKVLLDGMVIYNPFHSIGLFSVFDTDIIRNAEVYTGGFGADYGGRISSVMDITTRDGNKNRVAGKLSASTFGSKIMAEGPIKKAKHDNDGSATFVLSVKNSYLEQTSKSLYSYVDENGLPFNFLDVYGKLSLNAANGSKVNFFGFRFDDQVNNYKALSDFSWNAMGAGSNFLFIPGRSPVLIEGTVAYSSYEARLSEKTSPDRSSSINGFNLGFDFSYFLGRDLLKYGIEMQGFQTEFNFTNGVGRTISQVENTTELAAYVRYKATIGKLLFEPSFRVQWYASLSNLSPEPRLALKYLVSDRFRLKLAAGMYSQNLISADSDRDVVNLFYGFLSGPDNLPNFFDGERVGHRLQKANHLIIGSEFDIARGFQLNLEGYYKDFSQLTNLNRNKIYDDNATNARIPDLLKKDFIIEVGDAYGVDLTLKFEANRLYVWTVYSLGYVTKKFEMAEGGLLAYQPHYDRRHNANIIVSYTAGARKQWELNGRWNFGSGFPFTQIQGYYEYLDFAQGVNFDYITANGELGIIYADLNQGRLPTYHRLDMDVKRKFYFSERTILELNFGVTNMYNRANVFYVDRISNETVRQLPLMPSLGMSLSF